MAGGRLGDTYGYRLLYLRLQAVASDKVRGMKPAFEAELYALREERGCGATVTGEAVALVLGRQGHSPSPNLTLTLTLTLALTLT